MPPFATHEESHTCCQLSNWTSEAAKSNIEGNRSDLSTVYPEQSLKTDDKTGSGTNCTNSLHYYFIIIVLSDAQQLRPPGWSELAPYKVFIVPWEGSVDSDDGDEEESPIKVISLTTETFCPLQDSHKDFI